MALVLPMAGVQQYFCTVAMAFVDSAEDCPVETEKDCCKKERQPRPDATDCMVGAKALPDAGLPNPVDLPPVQVTDTLLEIPSVDVISGLRALEIHPQSRRGPPDMRRTYALHRRLLI